ARRGHLAASSLVTAAPGCCTQIRIARAKPSNDRLVYRFSLTTRPPTSGVQGCGFSASTAKIATDARFEGQTRRMLVTNVADATRYINCSASLSGIPVR